MVIVQLPGDTVTCYYSRSGRGNLRVRLDPTWSASAGRAQEPGSCGHGARMGAVEGARAAHARAADAIVVVPVAAIEQQGPHLPVMVDSLLCSRGGAAHGQTRRRAPAGRWSRRRLSPATVRRRRARKMDHAAACTACPTSRGSPNCSSPPISSTLRPSTPSAALRSSTASPVPR